MKEPRTGRIQRRGTAALLVDLHLIVGLLVALAAQKTLIATALGGAMALRLLAELAASSQGNRR